MTAVAGFVVTSGLCGLAWSAESLIGFRVLQGFAGGMIMPIGMITLAQAAGPQPHGPRDERRRRADAARAGARPGASAALIVENLSWRWIFFVNLPVGHRRARCWRARLLPARARGRARRRAASAGLDWRGLALLSPGVARDRLRPQRVRHARHLAAPSAWLPIVVGAGSLVAFVVHALARRAYPIVDVRPVPLGAASRPRRRRCSSSASRSSARCSCCRSTTRSPAANRR